MLLDMTAWSFIPERERGRIKVDKTGKSITEIPLEILESSPRKHCYQAEAQNILTPSK